MCGTLVLTQCVSLTPGNSVKSFLTRMLAQSVGSDDSSLKQYDIFANVSSAVSKSILIFIFAMRPGTLFTSLRHSPAFTEADSCSTNSNNFAKGL